MKIFGDAIDDKIFPKEIKRFTAEEKSLIDKFLNSILREDKKSELESSSSKSFNDRADCITEEIYKQFIFKTGSFSLRFCKFYTNEKKTIEWLPSNEFGLYSLENDGYCDGTVGFKKRLLKDLADEKSITGIFVKGFVNIPKSGVLDYMNFILKSSYLKDREQKSDLLSIRTKYEGSHLTTKCKNRVEKYHLKIIKDAILKALKSKKKKRKKSKYKIKI